MLGFALLGLFIIYAAFCDLFSEDPEWISYFFVALTIAAPACIVPAFIYRLILKRKVKRGEMSDLEAFKKCCKKFYDAPTCWAYLIAIDDWFFNYRGDDMFS